MFHKVCKVWLLLLAAGLLACSTGCATKSAQEKRKENFTSGSAEADRRAENAVPNVDVDTEKKGSEKDEEETPKAQTLYQRLGEEAGIRRIVGDFIQRVLEDPRVNWTRQGVSKRTWFGREKASEWQATPQNVERLKKHFVQFISLAAGGPSNYQGKPLRPSHLKMQITKAEFEAVIGDLKASLDKLQISADVQKDLLSVFESTRQQIVVER